MANKTPAPSLLDLFVPPDEMRKGVFGLMCALSADTSFIESALQNFTGQTANQRKQIGHCSMALFLDPSHRNLESIPGLAWGYPIPKEKQKRKIYLMHAKVALLGFGESAAGDPNLYRLIVITGNWTAHAVNAEINLVWYCDYDCTKEPQKQEIADIYESITFWRTLLDVDDSGNGYYHLAEPLRKKIKNFFSSIEISMKQPGKNWVPRFFSNIFEGKAKENEFFKKDSMGTQVLARIAKDDKRRNFICCGSGFFENHGETPEEPEVLKNIVGNIQKNNGLTKKLAPRYKYLVINGPTSGAAGYWFKEKTEECCWTFYEPRHPANNKASLHAKYIFVANWVQKTKQYTSGLLYLGSGNLSKQGFALGPGTGGNAEAGVFLEINESCEEKDLCEKLGISDNTVDPDSLQEIGNEDTEKGALKVPPLPPITSCLWNREDRMLSWEWGQNADEWVSVSLQERTVTREECNLHLAERHEPSFSIELRAKHNNIEECWNIPVFTEDGDFYRPPPRPKMPDEIIASIIGFPDVMPEEEEEEEEEEFIDDAKTKRRQKDNGNLTEARKSLREFPLHLATSLIEIIAQKNQMITEGQMPDWIAHLRRALLEEMDKEVAEKMRSIKLAFLEPLKEVEGFAPRKPTNDYKQLIDEISRTWKI